MIEPMQKRLLMFRTASTDQKFFMLKGKPKRNRDKISRIGIPKQCINLKNLISLIANLPYKILMALIVHSLITFRIMVLWSFCILSEKYRSQNALGKKQVLSLYNMLFLHDNQIIGAE